MRSLLLLASLVPALCATAHAQQAAPLIEVLPVGEAASGQARDIHVLALGPDGAPLDGVKLKASVSAGELGRFEAVSPGLYAARWTPPAGVGVGVLRVAVTVGKERASLSRELPYGGSGPARATAGANPTSLVVGQPGDATLSFSLVGADGRALDGADLLFRASSGEVRDLTPLGQGRYTARYVPAAANYPHLAIVTFADRRDPDRVRGYAVVPMHGQVDYPVRAPAGSTVILRVAGREFGPVVAPGGEGSVDVRVPVVVPPGVSAGTIVRVVGGAPAEEALDLKVPETRRVALLPGWDAVPASPDARVAVRAAVLAADGTPDLSASPSFTVTAGTVGPTVHEGEGIYRATWTPPAAAGDTTVLVSLPGSDRQSDALDVSVIGASAGLASEVTATGGAVRHVLLVPAQDGVAPGAPLRLVVLALDGLGHPVPGAEVQLSRLSGDGELPSAVTTGPGGHAEVAFVAGAAPGVVRIGARSGDAVDEVAVVQGATSPIALPRGASAELSALARTWTGAVRGAAPVGGPAPASPASGVAIRLRVDPVEVAAGGTITVHAHVQTADGQPLVGQDLEMTTSEGRFGKLNDLGEGDYLVSLEVPRGAGPAIEIAIAAPDGSASASLQVPVTGGAPLPVAPPPPVASTPGIRVRVGWVGSTYVYQQTPLTPDGPLLPEVLTVGRPAPASPTGFEVAARGVVPGLPWVGVSGFVRSTWYGIASDRFEGVVQDALVVAELDGVARYPFELAGVHLHAGARVGFRYDDHVYFTGSVDHADFDWATLGVPGLGLGAELGAEQGRWHALLGFREGLAYFVAPASTSLELEAGYDVAGGLSIELGLTRVTRHLRLFSGEPEVQIGRITDAQVLGTVGLGYAR